jgi:hypothetical protein
MPQPTSDERERVLPVTTLLLKPVILLIGKLLAQACSSIGWGWVGEEARQGVTFLVEKEKE